MSRYSPLGLLLRRHRDERGCTQTRMATALGVTQSWLSRLEGGREEMTESGLADAVNFLNLDAEAAAAVRTAWEASRLPLVGASS